MLLVCGCIVMAGSLGGIVRLDNHYSNHLNYLFKIRGVRAKYALERQRIFVNAYMITYNNRRLPGFGAKRDEQKLSASRAVQRGHGTGPFYHPVKFDYSHEP